jgi:hypothetical protein
VFSVRYELGFYIPEDGVLQSYRRKYLISYIVTYDFFTEHLVLFVTLSNFPNATRNARKRINRY